MDPLSATAAAVSIVCGIVGAVNSVQTMHERRKRKKEGTAAVAVGAPQISNSVVLLDNGQAMDAFEFSVRMNYLLSQLGQHLLDGMDRTPLTPFLKPVQISQIALTRAVFRTGAASGVSLSNSPQEHHQGAHPAQL